MPISQGWRLVVCRLRNRSSGASRTRFLGPGYVCHTPRPQLKVLPDYKGNAWALGDVDLENDEASIATMLAKDRWNSLLRRFLDEPTDVRTKVAHEKFYRRASYWFMQSLQKVFVLLTGSGLEQFATRATPTSRAAVRTACRKQPLESLREQYPPDAIGKTLAVAVDQCSVGLAALTYMDKVLHLKVEGLWDPFHRYWNNEKLGIAHAKWWDIVLLYACPFNINFGPFSGAGWLNQLQGVLKEYTESVGSVEDALFNRFLPSIARDRQEEHLLSDDSWVRRVWLSLQAGEPFASKGPKMAFCRWASFVDCFLHFDSSHHSRVLGMAAWGLNEGIVTKDIGSVTLAIENLYSTAPKVDSKAPMREVAAQVKDIRSKGKNQLHVALLVLLLPDLQRRGRTLVTLMLPSREWHSMNVRHMRNPSLCQEWYCRQAVGRCLDPLCETFAVFGDLSKLSYCGFVVAVNGSASDVAAFEEGGAQLEVEERAMARMAELAISLNFERLRHLLWHLEGCPGNLAFMLSDDVVELDRGMARFQLHFDAWAAAMEQENPLVIKAVEASFMNKPIVFTIASWCEAQFWLEVPEDAKRLVSSLFACPKTDLIEDAFHRLRQVETRAQSNMQVHPRRAWFTAYQQGILSSLHNFPEAQHTDCPLNQVAGAKQKVSPRLFAPGDAAPCPLPLKAIVDDKSQAFWPTYNVGSSTAAYAHQAVWVQARRDQGLWMSYNRLDMCMLMLPGLLVRRRVENGVVLQRRPEDFMLVLGVVERIAVLAWRCEVFRVGGTHYRRPRSEPPRSIDDVPYQWLVCTDADEWEAIPIKWAPPAAQAMLQRSRPALPSGSSASSASSSSRSAQPSPNHPVGADIREAGPPCSLLVAAAQRGFRGLGLVALRSLARNFKVELPANSTMFEVLMKLIKFAIPMISDDDLAKLLADYAQEEYEGQDDLLTSEAMKECFASGDAKELEQFTETTKKSAPMQAEIRQFVANVIAKKRRAVAKAKPRTASGRARQGDPQGAALGKSKLVQKPQQVLPEPDAQLALPSASWKIKKDFYNNRWYVSHPLLGNLSRSWTLYGDVSAAAMCLNFAWEKEASVSLGMGPAPHEWVREAPWRGASARNRAVDAASA